MPSAGSSPGRGPAELSDAPHRCGDGYQTRTGPSAPAPVQDLLLHHLLTSASPRASRSTDQSRPTGQSQSRRCQAGISPQKHAGPRSPLSTKPHNARSHKRTFNKAKSSKFLLARPSRTGLATILCEPRGARRWRVPPSPAR